MKYRVGLLSLSDGRGRVHEALTPVIERYNDGLVTVLETTGQVEVVRGSTPLNSPPVARQEAERLKQAGVECVIFQQPVFGFPHLAVIAAQILAPPFLVLSPK